MAYLFDDGSSQYLQIDQAVVTDVPFTMACFAYGDTDTATFMTAGFVGDKDAATEYHAIGVHWGETGNPTFALSYSALIGFRLAYSTTGVTVNTWHHLCGIFASSTDRRAFIDGGSRGNNTSDVSPLNLDRTGISGSQDSTPGFYWSGNIAEFAIWNVALTDVEVAILAKGYSPLLVRPQNLVSYWPLVRDSRDIVGNYNLTAYNSPTVVSHPRVFYPTRPFYSQIASAIAIKSVSSVSWASVKQVSSIAKANIKKISGV